ncbi:MAG TPA: DUF4105 domain-containing protein [Steroidobacteraceae bacterium]|nr:DUF4105 domain-containing protein [Steroidobacteraceae bacterium]
MPDAPDFAGWSHALNSLRRVLGFLIIAATLSAFVGGGEGSFLSPKAILYQSRAEVRQVTLTADQLSAPKVALATFGPGRLYWERFGHNAVIVDDPAAGARIAYNYGVFDFKEQHFLRNFALGHMHYRLVAEPLDADLAAYVAEGRSVTLQMLNLTPEQARQLAAFLAWNAQPQNADYRYDYFLNNCSTKVRDALNRALGGALERQLARRPAPHTYRFDAVRLISPDSWFALGMDMGLGPNADRPLSLWQESFVPEVLSHALRAVAVRDTNGHTLPLVRDEELVLAGKLPPAPAAPLELRLPFLAASVGLAALLLWLARRKGRLQWASFALLAVAWWLICGFSGLVLTGLWGLSDHWAAWDNENLLLLNPLCLILPVVWWRAPRVACWLATLIAVAALISLIIRRLPGLYQGNLAFIALAVPVHLVLAVLIVASALGRASRPVH